jgi:hypothetical protein
VFQGGLDLLFVDVKILAKCTELAPEPPIM